MPDLTSRDVGSDICTTRTAFLNAAGNMRVDVQSYGALSQPALHMEANKIITVLQGSLTLHDGQNNHTFAKGQTAYVHQGDTLGFTTKASTQLIVASYAAPA